MTDPDPVSRRDIQISAILMLAFFVINVLHLWNQWAGDLSAYYYAGHFFGLGQLDQVYAGPPQIIGPEMPSAWAAAVAEAGYEGKQTYPFLYLPWVATIMAPIARVFDPQHVMNGLAVLNSGLLMLCVVLTWRIMAPKTTPLWLWVLISVALLLTSASSLLALSLGQLQILVFSFCLLAFERYRAGAFWLAGIALGIAACLKITPALLILIFLWDRNWRALGGFFATCTVLGLYSLAMAGWPLHAQFFGLLKGLNDQVFIAFISFSIEALSYQLWDFFQGTAPLHTNYEYVYPKPAWIEHLAKAVFVTGLLAVWITTRRLGDDLRMPRQLLALSVLIPLTAPLGWVHYFLLTTLLLPGLLDHVNRYLGGLLILGYLLLLNDVALFLMISPGLRFMLQIILCVPFLMALFGAIVLLGRRELQVQPADTGQMLAAE